MTIRVEVETFSKPEYEHTTSYFRDLERPEAGYWQIDIKAYRNGTTYYDVLHDGWIEWQGQVLTGRGEAWVTRGKSKALPAFLRSHLPALLTKHKHTVFQADPLPPWIH